MSFKRVTSSPRTFLAVIYDEQYPVGSGRCWALSLVDASSQGEAAAMLAHYGGEMLFGKDCEFFTLPKAFVQPLAHIPRGAPIGDPNPFAREIQDVVGEWLEVMLHARRAKDGGTPRRSAVAPVAGGAIVADLTDEETERMLANEKAAKKAVH